MAPKIDTEQIEEKLKVRCYPIKYPASAYTFLRESRIREVRFDEAIIYQGKLEECPMLKYVKIRLTFKAATDLRFTSFKGLTIESLFKTSLRNHWCDIKKRDARVFSRYPIGLRSVSNQQCKSCVKAANCKYAFLVEHRTDTGENTVLPFSIACSSIVKDIFCKGELIVFNLLLIGKGIDYLGDIIECLYDWKKHDLIDFQSFLSEREESVRWHSRFSTTKSCSQGKMDFVKAEQITAIGLKLINELGGGTKSLKIETLSIADLLSGETRNVGIRFLSPVRLRPKIPDPVSGKRKPTLITPRIFSFVYFFPRLRRRYLEIEKHFGEGKTEISETKIKRAVQEVRTVKTPGALQLMKIKCINSDERRYDTRHPEHYDGLMGEVEFHNVSEVLVPWIKGGEILQVGKFPAMGFGEYRAEYSVSD